MMPLAIAIAWYVGRYAALSVARGDLRKVAAA